MDLPNLVNLAILWCLGLLALVQAINSRGPIRISLSWIVSIVIIVISVFFTYLHIVKWRDVSISQSVSSMLSNESSSAIIAAQGKSANLSSYLSAAQKITATAEDEIRAIEAFKEFPVNISAQVQEAEGRKALSLRNQTAQTNQRAVGLFHPRSVSEIHQDLIQATENLRLAGYSLHAYTGLDNTEERKIQRTQYLNQLQKAKKALSRFRKNIEQLTP